MTKPSRLPHYLHGAAAALVSAALALASQLALAHGGHYAKPAAVSAVVSAPAVNTPGGDEQTVVIAANAVPGFAQTAWSQSCPDGSGGDCCCKHQPVTPAVAKIALVHSAGWDRPAPMLPSRPASRLTGTPPQQPFVSLALPRAPPSFS